MFKIFLKEQFGYLKEAKILLNRNIRDFWICPTFKCNMRCKTCKLWKKDPGNLDINIIKKILSDKLTKNTHFVLEGGEFLLYSHYKEALKLLRGREYTLFTAGYLDNRLIEATLKYKIPEVIISLDGTPKTNKKIKGMDIFPSIEHSINELKGKTKLSVNYTMSKWNSKEDLLFVKKFCKKKVPLDINIYNDAKYLGATVKMQKLYNPKEIGLESNYTKFYNQWLEGKLILPCFSIRVRTGVYPNGDLYLCKKKDIILGNLYEKSLKEIWNSKKTKRLQKELLWCNDCWMYCSRKYDLDVINKLGSYLPKWIIKKILKKEVKIN